MTTTLDEALRRAARANVIRCTFGPDSLDEGREEFRKIAEDYADGVMADKIAAHRWIVPIKNALASLARDGFVLVPREATEAMQTAAMLAAAAWDKACREDPFPSSDPQVISVARGVFILGYVTASYDIAKAFDGIGEQIRAGGLKR